MEGRGGEEGGRRRREGERGDAGGRGGGGKGAEGSGQPTHIVSHTHTQTDRRSLYLRSQL